MIKQLTNQALLILAISFQLAVLLSCSKKEENLKEGREEQGRHMLNADSPQDINTSQDTLRKHYHVLMEAINKDEVSTVKSLLEDKSIDTAAYINVALDANGLTPLVYAVSRGNLQIVTLLVKHGADIFQLGEDIFTPLEQAITNHLSYEQTIQLINASRRSTPQHKACIS